MSGLPSDLFFDLVGPRDIESAFAIEEQGELNSICRLNRS